MVSRRQMFLWPDVAGAFAYAPTRDQAMIQDPVNRLREFCKVADATGRN